MIIISLVAAALLLILVNVELRQKTPTDGVPKIIFGGISVAGLCLCFAPVTMAQSVFLAGLFYLWRWRRWSPPTFLPWSIVGVLLMYFMAFVVYLQEKPKFDALRDEFRFESLADRLPGDTSNTSSEFDPTTLSTLETRFDLEVRLGSHRGRVLQQLHENQLSEFTNQPGFGQMRMAYVRPNREAIIDFPRTPIPQRGPARTFVPTMNEPLPMLPLVLRDAESNEPHIDSILDFVNARGFGYFKDREHVAGFQSHRFSKWPTFDERWDVERVELVGLLMHKQPVVYVSEYLPRMDELRQAPTRPLDAFETTALADVRQGDELRLAETPTGARMLGAIRSVTQCNKCHETERGALLGAFSYTLKTRTK